MRRECTCSFIGFHSSVYLYQVLREEIYSLTQKIDQKTKMEVDYQEEIEALKKYVARQRDELQALHQLTDQSALVANLKQRVRFSRLGF